MSSSLRRGLLRLAFLALATPGFSMLLAGCGEDTQKTGTVVPETTQGEQANKSMEDFMAKQAKGGAK